MGSNATFLIKSGLVRAKFGRREFSAAGLQPGTRCQTISVIRHLAKTFQAIVKDILVCVVLEQESH